MHFLTNLIAGIGMIVGSVFGIFYHTPPTPQVSYGAYNPTGGGTYRLQSSIGTSDTSLTLSSFKEPVSNIPYTMTYLNSSIEYATIDPQTSVKEFISFTGITQNADGTALLTGVTRGLGFSYPYTSSTTLQQAHSAQAILILSNPPQLTNQYANKNNVEQILAPWGFNLVLPTSTLIATTSGQFVTKALLDATTNQGAATSTETNGGIVRLGTLAEQANTYNGLPRDPAVLQTKNSTSTCQVVGSYTIVASSTTGRLDKNCFDQSTNYTLAATTTLAGVVASSTAAKPLVLNGLAYDTPSVRAASSTILMEDGNGHLTWNTQKITTISVASSPLSSTNSATTTIKSVTISPNTLSTSESLRISAQFRYIVTAGSCEYAVSLGNGIASTSLSYVLNEGWSNGMIFATSTTAQASSFESNNNGTYGAYPRYMSYNNASQLYVSFETKATSSTCGLVGETVEALSN